MADNSRGASTRSDGSDDVVVVTVADVEAEVRAHIDVEDALVDVDTADLKIRGRIGVQVHDVWLATPAEAFDAATGRWAPAAARPSAQQSVIALELNSDRAGGTGLTVRKLTVTVGGLRIPLDVPSDRQFLDLHAGVLVHLPVVVEPLHTRPTATDEFPVDAGPGVALVLTPADPSRPGVTVSVTADDGRLRRCPFVLWLLELAAGAGLDPERDVMVPLRSTLAEQVTTVVHQTLGSTTDDLVREPGRLLLYAATDPTVTSVAVQVDPQAIRVTVSTDEA
jgi:hypothetical protein